MIKNKRDSLERFIKEQLIGPGGCKGLYSLKQYKQEDGTPIERVGEVISTTPGSIYSTAILFPNKENREDADKKNDEKENNKSKDDNNNESLDNEEKEIDEIIDKSHEEDEDINSLSRRFPNSIGISCCLDSHFANENVLKIVVSGRYYTKITDCTQLEVIVEDKEGFNDFYNEYVNDSELKDYIKFKDNKLYLSCEIHKDKLSDIYKEVRKINKKIVSDITPLENYLHPKNLGFNVDIDLSIYKEKLFKKLSIINESYLTIEKVQEIKDKIGRIEKYETFLTYINDVISTCDWRKFGYWVEHPFNKELDLSAIDFSISNNKKVTFLYKNHPCLENVISIDLKGGEKLSLSCNLQLIKSEDKTYLKILIENSSSKVITSPSHYYSVVSEAVNAKCFFGINVDISSKHICPYEKNIELRHDDEEAKNLKFLYKSEDYGVGHLCSVNWKRDEVIEDTMHVFTEFLPSVEVPDVDTEPRDKYNEEEVVGGEILPKRYLDNSECLQFKWLSFFSETKDEDIKNKLLEFVRLYKEWIDNQHRQIESLRNKDIAEKNLKACENDYKRMEANVLEFLSEPLKMKAFRVMNAAMFMQLWHGNKENQKKVLESKAELNPQFYKNVSDDIFPNVKHAAWRPFQLAFILLNLDGIFKSKNDPNWSKRNELVDLVWFPTGGGKTEAYLGIIALTIINRRFTKGEQASGVTVIMRYTLRLLATQQFQRALRMIIALEQIRLWDLNDYNLGSDDISIGLFVGGDSLPNSVKELETELKNWINRNESNTHSKIPLGKCPLCGTPLEYRYKGNDIKIFCKNNSCFYGKKKSVFIPVRLCDEDIYKDPPALLFGTVDKFAQLAHKVDEKSNKDSRRLFGQIDGKKEKLTPDLIIQDELHLLLGPLGSAVSLFECAINQLCTREENGLIIHPKIITSTATTRNTALQIRALCDRGVSIFPKSGISHDDSFYAFYKRHKEKDEDSWSYISKRKYIGIMPTGRTQMATQMRLAAILFVHRAIFEKENISRINDDAFIKAADYYYTTISYFNSLKEVGKTDAQFYMEFTKYTRRLFKRVLRSSNMLECFYAYEDGFKKAELTGRLSGEEVIAKLDDIQSITWMPSHRLPFLSPNGENKWLSPLKPADYILATNMISVGLDVSRFNTIIMNSMPRNIAEYIQASSRVARDDLGLVLTLHNPFRSRDISHFERFKEFHEKLYYYVEPISITPFSHKTVEKYLSLFLATYVRHLYPKLANNMSASKIDKETITDIENKVYKYFDERFERTKLLNGIEKELLTEELLQYIKEIVHDLLEQWYNKKENLVYKKNNKYKQDLYSTDDYENESQKIKWNVPNALRIIEPDAIIHTLI